MHQLLRLAFEAFRRCGAFFNQGRVLLGGAVHLGNGFTHLADPLALLGAGGADLSHQVRHAADRADHFRHGVARAVHQGGASGDAVHAVVDEQFDFFGRLCTALGQGAHFTGDHRKTTALFTRTRSFDSSVERENIGLKSDRID